MKRTISFYGVYLNLLGACFALPLLTALIYRESTSIRAFSFVMILCFALGFVIRKFLGSDINSLSLKLRDSYLLVASVWLVSSVIGSLPYILTDSIPGFIDAFFETASGFTTTGATIIDDVESLPRAVLMWRSLTQWLGGMGIIVLFVALLPRFGIKARNIAAAETPGPTVTKLSSSFTGTAQRLYIAYIILTLAEIVLLMLGGMNLYDAANHSLTTMATGGFSTYADSIAHFDSYYITWVITIFMVLAGTNFELFFVLIGGGIRKMFRNEEFRLYLSIVVISTALITISLITQGGYTDAFSALTDAAFQVTTIMSTTGFATTDFNLWPTLCLTIIILLMISGGSSSSTAGGVKVIRVLAIWKLIVREMKIKLHGRVVKDVSIDRHKLLPETLTYIVGFVSMYIITLLAATLLISLSGQGDLISNFTGALSCISNVGPGLEKVGPVCTYSFYNGFNTFVLAIVMIAGRLELVTLFVVFSKYFIHPDRV